MGETYHGLIVISSKITFGNWYYYFPSLRGNYGVIDEAIQKK
ncbi:MULTISPECIES: hypothetical protein [unclassified Rickettsia]|nr:MULTISPECIES: hypothetical protein [unclassified Rickettsia]